MLTVNLCVLPPPYRPKRAHRPAVLLHRPPAGDIATVEKHWSTNHPSTHSSSQTFRSKSVQPFGSSVSCTRTEHFYIKKINRKIIIKNLTQNRFSIVTLLIVIFWLNIKSDNNNVFFITILKVFYLITTTVPSSPVAHNHI